MITKSLLLLVWLPVQRSSSYVSIAYKQVLGRTGISSSVNPGSNRVITRNVLAPDGLNFTHVRSRGFSPVIVTHVDRPSGDIRCRSQRRIINPPLTLG